MKSDEELIFTPLPKKNVQNSSKYVAENIRYNSNTKGVVTKRKNPEENQVNKMSMKGKIISAAVILSIGALAIFHSQYEKAHDELCSSRGLEVHKTIDYSDGVSKYIKGVDENKKKPNVFEVIYYMNTGEDYAKLKPKENGDIVYNEYVQPSDVILIYPEEGPKLRP